MPRKVKFESRCFGCGLPDSLCLCAELPRFETRTRVVLIMHWRETITTTNTGRFLVSTLANSELRLRGSQHARLQTDDLAGLPGTLLYLYPSEEAETLSEDWVAQHPGPFTLVIPDGTWRQARRVWKRESPLKAARAVKLALGAPSRYFLRNPPQSYCLSTLEAGARALGLLEGKHVETGLTELFEKLVTRHLSLRPPERVIHSLRRRGFESR